MTTNGDAAPHGPVDSSINGLNGPNGVDGPVDAARGSGQPVDGNAPPQSSGSAGNPQVNGAGATNGLHSSGTGSSNIKGRLSEQKDKIKAKKQPPGGYDSTPLPDAPPGYTVKFVFHQATNLPIADYSSGSSDPFLEATLTTSLPKRHKEDPNLVHRTPTVRRSTEPKWEDEWVVANVPSSGFKLKCRMYDEDWPDHNDRLGNVTIVVPRVDESWQGISHQEYKAKKRSGSKRAYLLKAATSVLHHNPMSPSLFVSITVLGLSNLQPNAQIHTVGPTLYYRHFSPMIGRLAGVQVNSDDDRDSNQPQGDSTSGHEGEKQDKKTKKYDFQAIELQLQGPVPPKLYHRYVEFKPFVGLMFSRKGIRGRILHKALTHQHNRIYNFDSSTEYGSFQPCSEDASMNFLKLCHFDQGGRLFTYVLTLDGLFRFTETGKEFGIDLLSKHTMHSDVATYIACSGEFFIRRLQKPTASEDPEPDQPTHPSQDLAGGPPHQSPPNKPEYYQLVIDNDSGTYRPDKSVLPDLQKFLEKNFPGLGVVALACDDDEDQKLKKEQKKVKQKEGENVRMVQNRSPTSSSFSSDDESDLDEMDQAGEGGRKSKKEKMWDMLEGEDPLQGLKNELRPQHGESSAAGANHAS